MSTKSTRQSIAPVALTLTIGTTLYLMSKLFPDPEVATRPVRLEKAGGDGETYDVRQDCNGHCYCECKGFLRWGHCKHIASLMREGLLDPHPNAPPF